MTLNKHYRKNKNGMTLIEIILAMAILGIIVVLMTPVMLSAFRMIILSGDRHTTAKGVAGQMENAVAGEAITATLGYVDIALPGGISVSGRKFNLTDGSGAYYVDLFGYDIESMSIFDPTEITTTSTIIEVTTTTIDPSATTADPTTGVSTAEVTTTAPSQPLDASLRKNVKIDVQDWRSSTSPCYIENTKDTYQFRIRNATNTVTIQDWTTCIDYETEIFFSTNAVTYIVEIRQINNISNIIYLKVRAAPSIALHKVDDQYTSFYIESPVGVWRQAVLSDGIELILSPGDRWNLATSTKQIKNLDTSYIYGRREQSINSVDSTLFDPASFPVKLTSFK